MQEIGNKIYTLRKKRGISQEELGYEIGVSRQTISKWESNAVQPNFENIKALCSALQVTSDYFMEDNVVSQVAADTIKGKETTVSTEMVAINNNKKNNTLIISSAIALLILCIIAICFCVVIGLTAFTSNSGDDIVSTFKYDHWSFIISFAVTIVMFTLDIFAWIKFAKIKKQKM